jgi:transposase-like protein
MRQRRVDPEKEQFWCLVLEEHSKSGLSAREFCRRESISEPSFYSWRRKFRQRDSVALEDFPHQGAGKPAALVELVPSSNHGLAGIEIETPTGVKIRFIKEPDAESLSAVLAAIERSGPRGDVPC